MCDVSLVQYKASVTQQKVFTAPKGPITDQDSIFGHNVMQYDN